MKPLNIFIRLLSVSMAVCKLKAAPDESQAVDRSYDAHGIVRQIAPDRHAVTIQHEAIVGYMPAMIMEFPVKDPKELQGISPSDEISFKLFVRENGDWVEDIHFVAHRVENVTNNTYIFHVPTSELQPGDWLPDCELMDETGRLIHLADFRGKAVAFTFFFSRCPLPDYCVRMSKNFYATRALILATPNAPTNWQLLSISFDPGFDKPEVLTEYANFFRNGDANHWLFAAASTNALANLSPQLDLMIQRDSDNITSHNLRTVVLDPQGRIFRQLDGNQWTPAELADVILKAARVQKNSKP